MKATQVKRGRPPGSKAKARNAEPTANLASDESGKHGPLFEKNVRYHSKDGSTCLVTYSKCKDKPIDVKIYTER